MPIRYVIGDPLLTDLQTLAFGHNARARTELGTIETRLLQRYPAPFAAYQKSGRADRIKAGSIWTWRESRPQLLFMVVRDSSVGATRLRYVQNILLKIARDYRLENIQSLAITRMGNDFEWREIKTLIDLWLRRCPIPIAVYETYQPGIKADES
ncbi:MAG: hypothetical protein MUF87_14250 [Anaerolineae bacterium]|nr:hypothetical protein [Anaerolineae bacterium]